jgi:beta-glucosidase
VVGTAREVLLEVDLAPFRAAIDAGVASIMTAHIAYPALDPSGTPATLSSAIVNTLLRTQFGFDGLIVTDALIMQGVLEGRGETDACVAAIAAGCDLLCYPTDVAAVVKALERGVARGMLDAERLHRSLQRRQRRAQWAAAADPSPVGTLEDTHWADALALRTVHLVRGQPGAISSFVDVIIVDDDLGGPYPPPSRQPFLDGLRNSGAEARTLDVPSRDGRRSTVIALFGDIRSWKGRPGYSAQARAAVERALAADPGAIIVQFGHPRLASEIPGAAPVVSGWGGERVMQNAVARWLMGER